MNGSMSDIDMQEDDAEEFSVFPDRYNVPVIALRPHTKNLMSSLLNPPRKFLTDSRLPRDWNGLAYLVGIGGERMPDLKCGRNATNQILSVWYQHSKAEATIKKLLTYLEQIDRFDVVDDALPLIEEDLIIYKERQKTCEIENIDFQPDNDILTRDDIEQIQRGLEPQRYDAFVLYADEDAAFASELTNTLEDQYKLKLCVKDRDLVAGVFEHDSVIRLISDRCNRLIAIISPAFLESSSNKFFCSFAQSLGIEQKRRKIIPCLYQPCKVPPEIGCLFMLKYSNNNGISNFWEKLRESVSGVIISTQRQPIYRSASQKIATLPRGNGVKAAIEYNDNSLKLKKDGVKFISTGNLNNNSALAEPIHNTSASDTDLTATINMENKKNKFIWRRLKKFLSHNTKCKGDVIMDMPQKNKKGFWNRTDKRKIALAT